MHISIQLRDLKHRPGTYQVLTNYNDLTPPVTPEHWFQYGLYLC